jgi:SAM-dependent methyltransferase
MATTVQTPAERAEALANSLFAASTATMETFAVYLGDCLGYYDALASGGPATSAELAARTGTSERYTREWLEQQAIAGVLDVAGNGDPLARTFSLPEGHAEVLTDRNSLSFMTPLMRLAVGITRPLDALKQAYRTGGGVPYPDYGVDTMEGIGDMNRVMFINQLASEWLPALPDIVNRLSDPDKPGRVADIGCGTGWSSIAIAQAFPFATVDGFDLDDASIDKARDNAASIGLGERLAFHLRDAADPELAGAYDLACAFECIHDMADPVGALAAMRRLVGSRGTVLIADERVADQFGAVGDEIERWMYGFSVLHCLPVGMADTPSAGTGTVMRTDTLREYATAAGFQHLDVLPIDHPFWRFYRLTA